MKKSILMSVGLSTLLLSSPVLAKTNHINLNVSPITGNQTSVNGKTVKLATVKVLHNKTVVGKSVASKNGTFKVSLKTPVKNGWKYTVQVTKKGFTPKKYTVTALYASTKTGQTQNNDYQNEIHDLQNMVVSLQSQLNDLKNKTQQATTTVITEPSNNTNNGSNNGNSNDDPIPTANQKKIMDLQNQIKSLYNQETAINQNMSQVQTDIDKIDPNMNSDIPSSYKLDGYNNTSLESLNSALFYYNKLVKADNDKLSNLTPNTDDYIKTKSILNRDNLSVEYFTKEIDEYNSMTKIIKGFGGEAGYLEAVQKYVDQSNSLKKQIDNFEQQINDLNKQIESLQGQLDQLEG